MVTIFGDTRLDYYGNLKSLKSQASLGNKNMRVAMEKADSEEELAITVCVKAVYWLAKENIPLSKYSSLVAFLKDLGTCR